MKIGRAKIFSFVSIILCALATSPALAEQTLLKPGAISGETLSNTNTRNLAFCEFYIGYSLSPFQELEIYNTTFPAGVGTCPAQSFAAIDPKKLAASLGAKFVILNPTRQAARKWWVVDQLYLYAGGEQHNFDGSIGTWVGRMGVRDLKAAAQAAKTPYLPLTNLQLSKWVYNAGSTVFLLRTPAGKVYVMQAYTTTVDSDLTYDQLPQLGSRLKKLPPGWTFETKTLTQKLTFDVRKATPAGLKHLTLDEFGNVYLGCGFDAACNYIP